MFNKAELCTILLLITKDLWMFNMSDLSIKLKSTEKSCIFPCKDPYLDSVALIPVDMLPRENWVVKLTFLISALKLRTVFH